MCFAWVIPIWETHWRERGDRPAYISGFQVCMFYAYYAYDSPVSVFTPCIIIFRDNFFSRTEQSGTLYFKDYAEKMYSDMEDHGIFVFSVSEATTLK